MKTATFVCASLCAMTLVFATQDAAGQAAGGSAAQAAGEGAAASAGGRIQRTVPGRPVKVAAICIGFGGEHDAKLKLALEHLETAGREGVDIACLPEEFAGTTAEPICGPTVEAVARVASKYKMYVICPIREQAGAEQYNTAVLLDRTLVHKDFNGEKVGRLLKEHAREVALEQDFEMEGWYLLRAVKPGIRVRALCQEYQIEPLREYRRRSRAQINETRKQGGRV